MSEKDKRTISSNIEKIKNDIIKYSPNPEKVKLLAATKTVDPERIKYALECGCDLIGENRVNELREKYDEVAAPIEKVHFIGRLQKNKVKYLIGKVSLIHSVDSISLAEEISRQSEKNSVVTDILVQVNIGGEESKGGVEPGDASEIVSKISTLPSIRVRGLMTIPPISDDNAKISAFFDEMQKIFVDIRLQNGDNTNIDFLSMGMSSDYIEALKHGANILRIGSAIFGSRG